MALYFFGLAVGVLVEVILVLLTTRSSGVLRIDKSNPEIDLYRFEINKIEDLDKKRKIVLRVDRNADLSQK